MKQIAFLVIILMMFAASVYAQPDEDVTPTPDSLQITEETEILETVVPETVVLETVVPETEVSEVDLPAEDETAPTVPNDPSSVLQVFFQSLKTGDSFMISQLISSDALDEIDLMLEVLKENLDDNEETTLSRLTTAGYTATADEIDDWSPMEYLNSTIVLPVMKARYAVYDMQIGDYSNHGNELIIPLLFSTASGLELPYQATLGKEDGQWKVTNFMGLSSFP